MNERKITFSFDKEMPEIFGIFSEFQKNTNIALKDIWNHLKLKSEQIIYENIKKKQLLLSLKYDPAIEKPDFRIIEFTIPEDMYIKEFEKDFIPFLVNKELEYVDKCINWLKTNHRLKSTRSESQYRMHLSSIIQFIQKPIWSWGDDDFTNYILTKEKAEIERKREHFEKMKKLGKRRGEFKEKGLSIKTIRQRKNILRSFMNYCIQNKIIEKSGITFLKESSSTQFNKNMDGKKDEEVHDVLLAFINLLPYNYRIMASALLLYECLRMNEALISQFVDVDFENQTLKVHGKGDKIRTIMLDRTAKAIIYDYILEYFFKINVKQILSENLPLIHFSFCNLLSPEIEEKKMQRLKQLTEEQKQIKARKKSEQDTSILARVEKEFHALDNELNENRKAKIVLKNISYNDWINELDSLFQICINQRTGLIFKHVAPFELKEIQKFDNYDALVLDKIITVQDQEASEIMLRNLDKKSINAELKEKLRTDINLILFKQKAIKECWNKLSIAERLELKTKEIKLMIDIRQKFAFTNIKTPYLFPSNRNPNKAIDITSAMHVFENVNDNHDFPTKYNCPRITSHYFRAWGATFRSLMGMTTSELQDFLGHSSPNTTRIYEKVSRERMLNAVENSSISVFMSHV